MIELEGKGGHAAYPHLANDMVVAASALVGQLQSVISRNVDPLIVRSLQSVQLPVERLKILLRSMQSLTVPFAHYPQSLWTR